MPWPKTGATHYHALLRFPNKSRAIKGLVVCNSWDVRDFGPAKLRGPYKMLY